MPVLVHNYPKADFYVTKDGVALSGKHVKLGTQYETDYGFLCYETSENRIVKDKDLFSEWNNFLGSDQTDIDPFTGKKSMDRIWSADGKRSIRMSKHEMDSVGTRKAHYHMETWYDGWVWNRIQRVQMKCK